METSQTRSSGSRHAMLGGAAVAAAGLLAALALVFTNATGVTEVAADAVQQQQIESAIGSTAAARNSVGQALLVASTVSDADLIAAAMVEAHRVLDTLEQRVAAVVGLLPEPAAIDAALDAALVDGRTILAAISTGDVTTARATIEDAVASFDGLTATLAAERDRLAASIAAAAGQSSTVATASRFMVAFFVPTLAVAVTVFGVRRRRKREQLAIALEHERAVNRSKDQLIANLSHELRTPLTGIYTAALALEDAGFQEPALSTELNGMIIDQSADLTRMVEDLLVSAQADAGRLRFDLKPTPISPLVESLVPEFLRAGANIELDIEPSHVLADDGRLRQVLRNLLSNAARYGGDEILVRGTVDGPHYRLEVSDDGPGVPAAVEDRLFERFVHEGDTPLLVGSVGLGLAITRVLADGMRGQVDYARRDDRSVFTVSLLREAADDGEAPPDPSPQEEPRLIEDEELVTDEELEELVTDEEDEELVTDEEDEELVTDEEDEELVADEEEEQQVSVD